MPISFTCPHCGLQTNVSDEYAGQTGPCAGCGKTITVPPTAATPIYSAPARRSHGPLVMVLVVVAILGAFLMCVGFMAALLLPAVGSARGAARRMQCINNLKQIGLAMHNYHSTFDCFPPAYVADENGKPMHSWRVLLLPYLEAQWLYDQYDFDEPWDGPNNSSLADFMPEVYRCPSDSGPNASDTSYMMIVGPEAISNGSKTTRLAQVKDGSSNTIMVVEVANSGTGWMEPSDLKADRISFKINDGTPQGIRSNHPGGACVLFCDGSVQFLSDGTDPEHIAGMASIAGGEDVSGFFVEK